MAVPNKTIYVSDGDLKLFQRAQELAGGNLSAAIAGAFNATSTLRRASARAIDDVVVRVGVGAGRKVRFTAVLVGEWVDSGDRRAAHYRVWRGRGGKYVLHVERQPDWWAVDPEGKPAGWRGHLGIGDVRYGSAPKESTLEVLATLDELRGWFHPSSSTWSRAPRASRPWRSSTSDPAPPGDGSGRCAMTTRTTTSAIEVRGLRKSFGKQLVLDGIDLDVAQGTVFALLGPERRRQDDRDPHPLDADLGRCGRGPDRGVRRHQGARRRPRRHRPHRPGLRGRRPVHGRGEPAPDGRPQPPRQGTGPATGGRAARAVRPRRPTPASPR